MRHDASASGTTRRLGPVRGDNPPADVVLVTGGGGFLGRHIVHRLVARGDRVRVFGRRPYPDLIEIGVDCRQGDLSDAQAVQRTMEGVEAVIHCGALPGIWGPYDRYYRTNYLGTKNVIDAAIAYGAKKMLYTSTPSVVHGGHDIEGGDERLPYPKQYSTPYAATKALAEKLVLNMNSGSFATAAIRPHLLFGPGDTQLIPKLLEKARIGGLRQIGNGRNRVSVSYVENVADAHLLALDKLVPGAPVAGQAYFVNQPEPVNCWNFINQVVTGAGLRPIRKHLPYSAAYAAAWLVETIFQVLKQNTEPPLTRFLVTQLATSHWFVVDKARRDLGWEPAVDTDEGLRRMIASLGVDGTRHG